MDANEHAQTAIEFLDASDREFEEGEILQGSEKLWDAAAHALMAVMREEGHDVGTHKAMGRAAERLASERGDPVIRLGFGIAEKFHANFYHAFMEEDQIERGRKSVREFVERLLPNGTLKSVR